MTKMGNAGTPDDCRTVIQGRSKPGTHALPTLTMLHAINDKRPTGHDVLGTIQLVPPDYLYLPAGCACDAIQVGKGSWFQILCLVMLVSKVVLATDRNHVDLYKKTRGPRFIANLQSKAIEIRFLLQTITEIFISDIHIRYLFLG